MKSPILRTFGCIVAILAAGLGAPLPAQMPPATATPSAPPTPPAIPGLTRPAPTVNPQTAPSTTKTVALKFNAAPMEQVLQFYSELTGRTILPAPGINATVTLRSQSDLTIAEAIQAIKTVLAMNNVGLVDTGPKFVKVVPIGSVQQEGLPIQSNIWQEVRHEENDQLLSEIIPLKYIDPAEAQKAISGLIHSYGKILPLERINSLLIADSSININRIKDVLIQIDQPLELKEKLHIMTIRHAKASDIKARMEEILADQKEKEKQTSGRRLKETGSPGVETATPPTIPGVIRARPAATTPTSTTEPAAVDEGEMIRGTVKLIADDRTGMLIIITRPENMLFFEQIVTALDVPTAPDVSVQVIRLEYADAESVASMLNALIGAASSTKDSQPAKGATSGTAASAGKTGESTEPARSSQLQEFIEQQRTLATRSTRAGEAKSKIGQLSAENIRILADERTNALIIMASKGDMASILDLLKDMDIMLSQVLIEAVILQVALDKTLERGVDWVQRSMVAYDTDNGGRDPLFAFAGAGGGGTLSPKDALSLSSTFSAGGGLTYYFTHFGLNMDAVIKLTQTDSRGKVLSSPIILTTDNKEAIIKITENRYFYKGVRYVGYSGTEQQLAPDVESKDIGLTLTVKPRINAKKFVSMEIKQEIQNISGEQAIEGQGNWPIVASREMTAAISVRSGETIVLGGLVEKSENNSGIRIPLLGSIPILGIPFRSTTDKDLRREIVVFITPTVLDNPEEIEAESARRKSATTMNGEGMWENRWSNSKLAEPPRGRVGQWWRNLLK